MPPTRIIKKYPNRRLYDTSEGIYITLEDIKSLVLKEVEFKVIDSRTEKDLTQMTLLQIISEQEASSSPIFTTNMLQDFIRHYHSKSQHVFSEYLEQAMHVFAEQKETLKGNFMTLQKMMLDPAVMQNVMEWQKKFWGGNGDEVKKGGKKKKS